MSKPTKTAAKIRAIDIVVKWIQLNIDNGFETDEVRAKLNHMAVQLEKRKQRLLNPPPRKPRQQPTASGNVATYAPDGAYQNAKERRGRGK